MDLLENRPQTRGCREVRRSSRVLCSIGFVWVAALMVPAAAAASSSPTSGGGSSTRPAVVGNLIPCPAPGCTPPRTCTPVDSKLYSIEFLDWGNAAYWPGWNIARGVALSRPETYPESAGGYVLDGFGGVHPFRQVTNPPPATGGPWWPGWDIARGIATMPNGNGGYIVDAWGGIHPFAINGKTPPPAVPSGYWPGWDIAAEYHDPSRWQRRLRSRRLGWTPPLHHRRYITTQRRRLARPIPSRHRLGVRHLLFCRPPSPIRSCSRRLRWAPPVRTPHPRPVRPLLAWIGPRTWPQYRQPLPPGSRRLRRTPPIRFCPLRGVTRAARGLSLTGRASTMLEAGFFAQGSHAGAMLRR